MPRHGRPLDALEARRIGAADLAYLDRLTEAAPEASDLSLPPGHALLHVYAVDPPRPNTDDFEVYGLRAANARTALAEFGTPV